MQLLVSVPVVPCCYGIVQQLLYSSVRSRVMNDLYKSISTQLQQDALLLHCTAAMDRSIMFHHLHSKEEQ